MSGNCSKSTTIKGAALLPNVKGGAQFLMAGSESPGGCDTNTDNDEPNNFAFINYHYTRASNPKHTNDTEHIRELGHVFIKGDAGTAHFVPSMGPPTKPTSIFEIHGICRGCHMMGPWDTVCAKCSSPAHTYMRLSMADLGTCLVCKRTGLGGDTCDGGCYICSIYTPYFELPTQCDNCGYQSRGNNGCPVCDELDLEICLVA